VCPYQYRKNTKKKKRWNPQAKRKKEKKPNIPKPEEHEGTLQQYNINAALTQSVSKIRTPKYVA
jgi:hypothetical protein